MKTKLFCISCFLLFSIISCFASEQKPDNQSYKFRLKGLVNSDDDVPLYTFSNFNPNGIIECYNKTQIFKIKEIQFRISNPKAFFDFTTNVIPGDSIKSLYDIFNKSVSSRAVDGGEINLYVRKVKIIGPDSIVRIDSTEKFFARVYSDSSKLLINKYLNGYRRIANTNIRIKIEGSPTKEDIQTIQNIVNEINSLNLTISAKIVQSRPTITVRIDSTKKSYNNYYYSIQKISQNPIVNALFPNLMTWELYIKTNSNNQESRNIFFWQKIIGSLCNLKYSEKNQGSIIIGRGAFYNSYLSYDEKVTTINEGGVCSHPGLSYEDKLALKAIFSNSFKISDFNSSSEGELSEMLNKVSNFAEIFGSILFLIILFFIIYEIHNYFRLDSLIKNVVIRNTIYAIVLTQLVIVLPMDRTIFWQNELYWFAFIFITIWLFYISDLLVKRFIKPKWLQLSVNLICTNISLYIAYQGLYFFVRGEYLKFSVKDIGVFFVAISVTLVRFYLQYENAKITSLIQEKEYELTKHKELKTRAELSALQSRINPHFLYNSLNSIAALAHIDSTRTENMALSLSKLFRYNLNREDQLTTTIGEEIEMVQIYIEIEKQRFTERLNFSISVEPHLNNFEIPRFLIQPLVENAIKHGIAKIKEHGFLKIKVYELNQHCFIEIYDNGPGFPDGLLPGFGLQNTYDNLNLVYKKPYEIRFKNMPEKFIQIKL
jgi:two-component system, LytTR family, sensor kinase